MNLIPSSIPIWRATVAALGLATTVGNVPALTTNLVAVADTSLFEYNSDNNLGGMDAVISGTIALGARSRGLLKFDVASALPANATVTTATLNLSVPVARGFNQTYRLHRILKDWGEGRSSGGGGGTGVQGAPANPDEATWNARFHPNVSWGTPGGQSGSDYAESASASTTMGVSSMSFNASGLAADVQLWLASPATNFGWMLLIANELPASTASRIASRESPTGKPTLTVEYTIADQPAPVIPPLISNPVLEAEKIRFSFNAQSNRTYAIEFRDSLTTSNWTELQIIPAQPADTTLHVTNDVASPQGYFRVRTP
ncbi:MAG: DNRLRE domain-containing protein [Verrucomicrobia bacterium]|nr:DNRLRE domain-containing protein [Verrucomicrobiota bacterium]